MAYNPANDDNCIAWYPMTTCKFITDLTGNNPTLSNEGNYPRFSYNSGDYGYGITAYHSSSSGNSYIASGDLVSGFPNGGTFSVVFWHNGYPDNNTASFDNYTDCGRWKESTDDRSWRIVHRGQNPSDTDVSWGLEISPDGTSSALEQHWSSWVDWDSLAGLVYHVAVTYNSTSGAYRIRVWDGVNDLVYNDTGTFSASAYTGASANFTIGGCQGLPSFAQSLARMDDLSIYNVVLDAQDIDNLRLGNAVPTDWGDNCKGWWGFDSSHIWKDSHVNANHITEWTTGLNTSKQNSAGFYINTTDPQYGDYCIQQENIDCYYREEISNLSSAFPFRASDTVKKFSICFWIKPETINAIVNGNPLGYRDAVGKGPVKFKVKTDKTPYLTFWDGVAGSEEASSDFGAIFVQGDWYHVGITVDGNTGAGDYRLRIWDETNEQFLASDTTGTVSNLPLSCKDNQDIGFPTTQSYGTYHIDDVVIFNRILTTDEIDEIRQQTFDPTPDQTIPTVNLSVAGETDAFQIRIMSDPPRETISERLGWMTDIIKPNFSDDEQRIALRTIPRQEFTYEYVINTLERRGRFLSAIAGYAKKEIGIPIWGERVVYNGTLSAGTSSISIDTTNADFRNSSYAFLWNGENSWELLHISTKNDTTLNLSLNLIGTYTGTSFIMPLRTGFIKGNTQTTALKNNTTLVRITLEVNEYASVSGWSASQTYDSYDVITFGNLIREQEGIGQRHNPDAHILDNQTGLVGREALNDYEIVTQEYSVDRITKAQIWELRQWLHNIYGRQKAFLVPSYNKDLVLTRAVDSGDSTIYIQQARLWLHYEAYDLLQYIGFLNSDGTVTIRKVSSIDYVGETEESITFTGTVGTSYTTSTTVMFVWKCRLGTDNVKIEWYEFAKAKLESSLVKVTV